MNRSTLILVALMILMGCEPREVMEPADQSVRPARIFIVTKNQATIKHQFVGRIEAAQTVDMSFEVSGPLKELPVLEGQTIATGDLIAALNPTDYVLRMREAEVQLKLANQDLTRKRKLLTSRGISQSLVDDAQSVYELRSVALAQAREDFADTKLYAPFDAYVARRFTDNHVNIRSSEPIVRLTDLHELFVVTSIPENLFATVTAERVLGLQARFAFLPKERFNLTFRENTGEAESVAQTYRVTFVMDRPEAWNILPGMTATVHVELKVPTDNKQQIKIPTSALVTDEDSHFYVWLYDPASQLVERRPVTIGPADGEGITVLTGLEDGDHIVASGASHLQRGMRVRILGKPSVKL
jgi:RND family efflux transporter MFP subunit|tara:strand:- start:11 stop:1078 length:1068 start_codon:yes stop_codon:yes gene_type:complete